MKDKKSLDVESKTTISIANTVGNGESLIEYLLSSTEYSAAIVDVEDELQPLVYVSDGFEKLTGYSRAEVIGKNCRFLQRDRRDQDGIQIIRNAIKTGTACQTDIINFKKNGDLFYNRLQLFPILSADRKVRRFLSIQNDVTDFVQKQAVLAENSSKYIALIDYLTFPICLVNHEGLILEANRLMRRHYFSQYSEVLQIGHTAYKDKTIDGLDDNLNQEIHICINQKEPQTIDRFSLQMGELKFLKYNIVPIDVDGTVDTALIMLVDLTSTLSDTSQKNKASNDLQKIIHKQLRSSLIKERNRLAMELHDNVCQLITALSFEIQQLKDLNPTRVDKTRKILELLDSSIRETIDQLVPDSFMADSLQKTINILFKRICNDNVKLGLVVDYEKWLWEEEDLKSLLLIVQELFSNTMKHSKASKCTLKICEENNGLMFNFSDNGIGLPSVFTFHNRLRFGGLANVQERISDLGGELNVSTSDNGTSICFLMPYPNLHHV